MFEYFLEALPPDPGVRPLEIAATPSMPPELVAFYREIGIGSFGGGVVFFHPPSELQPMLDVWVPPSPTRIPFARTAFGDIFYARDLRTEAAQLGMTGENPGELGDVSWVDVHFQEIEVIALSVTELFDEILGNPTNVETVLRGPLVRAAREIHGPLGPLQQLAFVPALALGGEPDLASVQVVDMQVHTALLRQLG